MSGFNWNAYGPGEDEPSTSRRRGSEAPERSAAGDWDFVLGGNDAGLSTEAMSSQIEDFLAAAEQAQEKAAAVTSDAWDQDHLVHVTVNSAGVVVSTEFDADAMRRSTARRLAAAVTEAAQTAASRARAAVEEHLDPLLAGVTQLDEAAPDSPGTPDVNRLFEDARELQRRLYSDPGSSHTTEPRRTTRGHDHDR